MINQLFENISLLKLTNLVNLLGRFLGRETSINVVDVSVTAEPVTHIVLILSWNEVAVHY